MAIFAIPIIVTHVPIPVSRRSAIAVKSTAFGTELDNRTDRELLIQIQAPG
jgi:hypothetical protein